MNIVNYISGSKFFYEAVEIIVICSKHGFWS